MGSNLVVVALPADDEVVWKVSSEVKPHLTMLFLGESDSNPNTERIVEFVQHAIDVSEHGPFYMDVDYRGTLGPDEADVLFFRGGWSAKWITQFRSQLLQNTDIKSAYDSTQQYPEWQPHLTLGYPTAPAHEDKMPEYGLNGIRFDRIAVWTTDFDGPEFRLQWPEYDGLAEVAWSAQRERGVQFTHAMKLDEEPLDLEALLEHHGVKGMKWGVRKDRQGRDRWSPKGHSVKGDLAKATLLPVGALPAQVRLAKRAAPTVKRVAKDVYFESDWGKDTATRKVAVAASSKWAEHDVPRLNAEYKGTKADGVKGRLKNPLDPKTIEYRSRSRAAYRDRLNEEVAKLPGNASGTRRYQIEDGGKSNANYLWHLKAVDIKRSSGLDNVAHAATDTPPDLIDFQVKPTFDEEGFIIGFKQVSNAEIMTHALTEGEEFVNELLHYGVKGMRWGVRKEAPSAVSPKAESRVPHGDKRKTKLVVQGGQNHPAHEDAIKAAEAKAKLAKSGPAALSNKELRDLKTRLELEQQTRQLASPAAKKWVKGFFKNQGNQQVNQFASAKVRKKLAY